MKLFRSIGTEEFLSLISNGMIHGKYNCITEQQNDCDMKGVCCFYVDEVMWIDKKHRFLVVVDIPEEELCFGNGTYFAAKDFAKTKVWSGRNGNTKYSVREAYCDSYSLSQVKEIFLFGHYTNTFVKESIIPVCEKYGISVHHMCNVDIFANNEQEFVQDENGVFKTKENYNNWEKQFLIDEAEYIEKTKKMLLSKEISLRQAKQIRAILQYNM